MKAFELARARSLAEARSLLAQTPGSAFKAGGVDLLDHMKEHLAEPPRVVDLKGIPGLAEIAAGTDGTLRIGPLATLATVADHAGVRRSHPALAEACEDAASPQIRNAATIGGNLLQRPRCWYYRLESYRCLKKGGSTCFAYEGENRYHSIFGGGPSWATHPSNTAVALVAYGAAFVLESDQGRRTVPAMEFFRPPSEDPERENVLRPGELLVGIEVPSAKGLRSAYAALRERAAFDWPLVSVAAALRLEGGAVKDARIVLGAVAPIPWRSALAERALAGRKLDAAAAAAAGDAATQGAEPLSANGYKVELTRVLVRRTLLALA